MKEKMTISDFRELLYGLVQNGYGGFEDIADEASSLDDEKLLSYQLINDFGMDSLDILELSVEIEKRYDIPPIIEDSVVPDTTVQELLDMVNA